MKNEVWGYARVSTKEQNLARQIEQLKEFGISERNIKCDKISGKTFNRMEYNALVGTETTAPTLRAAAPAVALATVSSPFRIYSTVSNDKSSSMEAT